MNGWMGGQGWVSGPSSGTAMYKQSDIVRLTPSQAFVFIEEHPDSMNDGALQTDRNGYPNNMRMIDFPGGWHERGANLSFADGHSEYWKWKDVRTAPLTAPYGNILIPRNPDLVRLVDAATSVR